MKHLTVEQRYTIWAMIQQECKQKDIALAISKDKSVVSRELRRNCDKRKAENIKRI
jgi:IS30 family transposase